MRIFAIDPGTTKSAFVHYDDCLPAGAPSPILDKGIVENAEMLSTLRELELNAQVVIEMVASYGMPVGREVFETVRWTGRFQEAAGGESVDFLYRKDVKMHLCNSMRAKDGNIRQALLDLFPPAGGGKTPQVGTKKEPGPLFGVSKDIWAALGVAVTYASTRSATVG